MVVAAGADAIGLNFYPGSKRFVDLALAQRIAAVVPPLVQVIGVFVNPEADEVTAALAATRLDVLQFHGSENDAFCRSFNHPFIKVLPGAEDFSIDAAQAHYPAASALMLDTVSGGQFGGSGHTFDWAHFPKTAAVPLILAGGLGPDNVAAAIAQTAPFAVDVSSGVECAPGRKDEQQVQRFIAAVSQYSA